MPFILTAFSVINKRTKIHVAVWSIFNEKTRDDASIHSFIQYCELYLGHVDLISSTVSVRIFWTVVNAFQLEQNKAQANIREVKQNKVAWSPVAIAPYGAAEVHSHSCQKGWGHFISRS